MQRSALLAAGIVAALLIATATWQHHRRADTLAHRQADAAPAPAIAMAPRTPRRGVRDDGPRPPLGTEPTHDEIERLVRQETDEQNRAGGLQLVVTQTGQRLPPMLVEVRGLRFPGACLPHDAPTEHPHWTCQVEVERYVQHFDDKPHWDALDLELSRFPDGGIDTLQDVVRWERGERPR